MERPILMHIRNLGGALIGELRTTPDAHVSKLYGEARRAMPHQSIRLVAGTTQLDPSSTLAEAELTDGQEVTALLGSPVMLTLVCRDLKEVDRLQVYTSGRSPQLLEDDKASAFVRDWERQTPDLLGSSDDEASQLQALLDSVREAWVCAERPQVPLAFYTPGEDPNSQVWCLSFGEEKRTKQFFVRLREHSDYQELVATYFLRSNGKWSTHRPRTKTDKILDKETKLEANELFEEFLGKPMPPNIIMTGHFGTSRFRLDAHHIEDAERQQILRTGLNPDRHAQHLYIAKPTRTRSRSCSRSEKRARRECRRGS